MPEDWTKRVIYKEIEVDGRKVLAVAPCPEDVIVSKLARLAEKDKEFIAAYHAARPLNAELIAERIKTTNLEPALQERALNFVDRIARRVQ